MAELADTIDTSIRDAVTGLRERGYSWAEAISQAAFLQLYMLPDWPSGCHAYDSTAKGMLCTPQPERNFTVPPKSCFEKATKAEVGEAEAVGTSSAQPR